MRRALWLLPIIALLSSVRNLSYCRQAVPLFCFTFSPECIYQVFRLATHCGSHTLFFLVLSHCAAFWVYVEWLSLKISKSGSVPICLYCLRGAPLHKISLWLFQFLVLRPSWFQVLAYVSVFISRELSLASFPISFFKESSIKVHPPVGVVVLTRVGIFVSSILRMTAVTFRPLFFLLSFFFFQYVRCVGAVALSHFIIRSIGQKYKKQLG